MAASGRNVFQLHDDRSIWRSTGIPCAGGSCPGWEMLDSSPATSAIAASGNQLYQLHSDGSVWRSTGTACSGTSCAGWLMLDNNPATTAIAAGTQLFPVA
jgi:hypothetical protein